MYFQLINTQEYHTQNFLLISETCVIYVLLTATIELKYCYNGIKHHNNNAPCTIDWPNLCNFVLPRLYTINHIKPKLEYELYIQYLKKIK